MRRMLMLSSLIALALISPAAAQSLEETVSMIVNDKPIDRRIRVVDAANCVLEEHVADLETWTAGKSNWRINYYFNRIKVASIEPGSRGGVWAAGNDPIVVEYRDGREQRSWRAYEFGAASEHDVARKLAAFRYLFEKQCNGS